MIPSRALEYCRVHWLDGHNCRLRKMRSLLRRLKRNFEHLGISDQQLSLVSLPPFLLLDNPEEENSVEFRKNYKLQISAISSWWAVIGKEKFKVTLESLAC